MDEKRAAAAALGYPQLTVNKDDRQLYEDCTTASVPPSTVAGTETEPLPAVGEQKTPEDNNEGQYDFVPHFQRVSIGGEDNSGVMYNMILTYTHSLC